MRVIFYLVTIINILCILSLLIINYLKYKNIIVFKKNKIIEIVFIISAILFMITRNLL